jgi:hypothetical protein
MSGALYAPDRDDEKKKRVSSFLWFVGCGDVLRGPFTHDQLLRSLSLNEFEPGDYCWRQGFHEWRAICSVEDFEFGKKPYIVKAYPTVPVPSAQTKGMTTPSSLTSEYAKELLRKKNSYYFDQVTEPKKVKVRLERRNRFEMGLWERTGMILFAIFMAWVSSWVALSEVQDVFQDRFEKWSLGQVSQLGIDPALVNETPMTLQQLQPLLSAPGLSEAQKENWHVTFEMQRRVVDPETDLETQRSIWMAPSMHALEWSSEPVGEKYFRYPSDPIYVETYRVYAIWNMKNPKVLRVRTTGYPGL